MQVDEKPTLLENQNVFVRDFMNEKYNLSYSKIVDQIKMYQHKCKFQSDKYPLGEGFENSKLNFEHIAKKDPRGFSLNQIANRTS